MKSFIVHALLGACAIVAMLSGGAVAATEIQVSGLEKIKLAGRIQYDYNRSELNDVRDEDSFKLRRGRLAVSGAISDRLSFKTQFNVNGGGAEDLYLRYKFGNASATIGNQKMPFGLEQLTSSNDASMLERTGLSERYTLGRREGLVLDHILDNSTLALGVYRDGDADDERGVAVRFTREYELYKGILHIGAGWRSSEDNGKPSATEITAAIAEFGMTRGAFHLQAEYADAEENGLDIKGYYVQAGWALTGETRPYFNGSFKRIAPEGSGPAWELVVRYEDGDGDYSDIKLGLSDAKAMAIGVNLYPSKNMRLGLNYSVGEHEVGGDEGNELRLRAQLTF